ncbi:hypothetical protein E6H36_04605 [Candidatus Bathyarchaeota archaeon]|nr:MAG: hypothetical protein E6H36_04605 [Candidatus Bathyarchaeota archaeon]
MIESLTVVAPMRNEEETARTFLERLTSALGSNAKQWRIIIPVTATDQTAAVLRRYPVVILDVPPGLGVAYSVGLKKALEYESPVLTLDTDLSHVPEEMSRLLEVDGDLVLGARATTAAPLRRRLISWIVNWVLGGAYSDYTSAYRLYTRPVLEDVLPRVKSQGFAFLPEFVFRALHSGFRVTEVKVSFPSRVAGTSKMSLRANLTEYLRFLVWRYFS